MSRASSMPQGPEHSGELSQPATAPLVPGVVRASRRGRVHTSVAPTARKTRSYYETLSLSSAGLELGLSVVIGALFGRWVDRQLGTEPLFMILLLCVGFGAGVRGVLRSARRAVSDRAQDSADSAADAAADAAAASKGRP
jgi:F0F1-type ATP synthase assembly protein I